MKLKSVQKDARNRSLSFRDHFVRGLAAMITVQQPRRRKPRPDVETALRGDFSRIGTDMKIAVEKAQAHEKAAREKTACSAE